MPETIAHSTANPQKISKQHRIADGVAASVAFLVTVMSFAIFQPAEPHGGLATSVILAYTGVMALGLYTAMHQTVDAFFDPEIDVHWWLKHLRLSLLIIAAAVALGALYLIVW